MKFHIIIILLFLSLGFAGCKRESKVVARVGHYELTQDEVKQSADAEDFVNAWVENRLLALEAEARKMEKTADFRMEWENIRASLLAEFLLQQESATLADPTPTEIESYYRQNAHEFRLTVPEVEYIFFSGTDDSIMNDVRKALLKGEAEGLIAERFPSVEFGSDRVLDPESMPEPYEQLYNKALGAVIGPVTSGGKLYVLRISAVYEPGSLKPINQVQDLIRKRIMENRRFQMKEKLLKNLRNKYNPELSVELIRKSGIISGEIK
jgi:hypothetical protein